MHLKKDIFSGYTQQNEGEILRVIWNAGILDEDILSFVAVFFQYNYHTFICCAWMMFSTYSEVSNKRTVYAY